MKPHWQAIGISTLLVGREQVNTASSSAFKVFDDGWLDPSLGNGCFQALTTEISCHPLVKSFKIVRYRGSLGSTNITDTVCTVDCQTSLKSWFNTVSSACVGVIISGQPANRLGGNMWAGWNETCVKDPKTKQYCNDIIANFTVVPNIQSMPQSELCSTCFGRRLALMQSSPYSTFDDFYQSQLAYVYSKCGGSGPTSILAIPGTFPTISATPTAVACSGTTYRSVEGDTCDKIAGSNSVSAAGLYMANQDTVRDCSNIKEGLSICLPAKCKTYNVQTDDTCVSIEVKLGMVFGDVAALNPWVNADCSNLQTATGWYGRAICVGPQGGEEPGSKTQTTPTPTGCTAAPTPTQPGSRCACKKWHKVVSGDLCYTLQEEYGFDLGDFLAWNPGVGASCQSMWLQYYVCVQV
ncbi:hypothetical protein QBC47DRAFT_341293 [Echria macrotheca]|uniref:LysM domain-containing protein n=1 Tax=Echria macrotheca TaxID=438768 RepID=A0AAJ0FCZ5_9PEZI|nr:hypothetical protein QBC47DRAFT_341293 [Echria macrotheca]